MPWLVYEMFSEECLSSSSVPLESGRRRNAQEEEASRFFFWGKSLGYVRLTCREETRRGSCAASAKTNLPPPSSPCSAPFSIQEKNLFVKGHKKFASSSSVSFYFFF